MLCNTIGAKTIAEGDYSAIYGEDNTPINWSCTESEHTPKVLVAISVNFPHERSARIKVFTCV